MLLLENMIAADFPSVHEEERRYVYTPDNFMCVYIRTL